MIATFTALLLAHAFADFVLQTKWMVERKREPQIILLHGVIVLLTAQAALGQVAAWQIIALAAAHLIIDAIKTYGLPRGLWPFLGDQAAHIATIMAVTLYAPDLWANGIWANYTWLPAIFAMVAGLIITTRAGGFAIGFLMAPWSTAELPQGLPNGGALIGTLERALIFLLVMVGQPAGIGFLIAAKSVLRFDTTSNNQGAGEYVIIGTLASFGWALTTSYATVLLLRHLPPLGILPLTP